MVDHVGAAPVPPDVNACPTVPAALAMVSAVVKFKDAMVGAVANTLLPVPVLVTLTKFLLASVATALDAVKPATLAVVPTNSALAMPTPPAVIIDPDVVFVASVTNVELIPNAKGIRAVVVVCPSLVMAVDKPVARSAVSALKTVLLMDVPVTTGCPDVLIWNVPEPL